MKERELEPTKAYIERVCGLYDFIYDDRIDNIRRHEKYRSLRRFQEELELENIYISVNKIRKILITGGRYSTGTSRKTQQRLCKLTASKENGGQEMNPQDAIRQIAFELQKDVDSIYVLLPYRTTVHSLENKTKNARRIDKFRKKKKNSKSEGMEHGGHGGKRRQGELEGQVTAPDRGNGSGGAAVFKASGA